MRKNFGNKLFPLEPEESELLRKFPITIRGLLKKIMSESIESYMKYKDKPQLFYNEIYKLEKKESLSEFSERFCLYKRYYDDYNIWLFDYYILDLIK